MEHAVPSENFQRENGTIFSEVQFCSEIFQWNEPKNHFPFTTQPKFPESLKLGYPGPRGFLLFFIGKFCDANRFLNFFLLARSAESREKKASGRDRWEPHFHSISF